MQVGEQICPVCDFSEYTYLFMGTPAELARHAKELGVSEKVASRVYTCPSCESVWDPATGQLIRLGPYGGPEVPLEGEGLLDLLRRRLRKMGDYW